MIGIVVVSHSRALGEAAAALASEMVAEDARPAIQVAAGLDETTFGTDAAAISEAITEVDSGDGVLVIVDLGSAILSAEMALEFIDPDVAGRTMVSAGPLVEGLIAALVTASTGASLAEVAAEAARGLVAKQEQLGGEPDEDPAGSPDVLDGDSLDFTWVIRNKHGLHARPAAALVSGIRGLDADVLVRNETSSRGPVSGFSLTSVQSLGLRRGDTMEVSLRGVDAQTAYDRISELAQADFGEVAGVSPNPTPPPGHPAARQDPRQPTYGLQPDLPTQDPTSAAGGPASRQDDRGATYGLQPDLPTQNPTSTNRSSCAERSGVQDPRQPTYGLERDIPTTDPTSAAGGSAATGRQIAFGESHHVASNVDISGYTAGGTLTETQRFEKAVGAVTDTLHRLADSSATDIYAVQELLLADAVPEVIQEINSGNSAVDAVTQRFTTAADQLETIDDPYLRARAQDQRGIMRMLLRALLGKEISPGLARGILILDELDPVTAGALDPWLCQGIITTSGGSTGHGAIVAQARGFALLTGKPEAHDIPEGTVVAIDPVANRLWINPTPSQIDELRGLQVRRQAEADEASRLAHEPALTQSGKRILVEANLASIQEAYDAGAAGAEGSGVVRTEILFGDWDHAPTIEEQAAAYIEIGKALNGGTITVRTWDPGGDKPLVFLPQDREANPMLGERGIRVMKRLPHLFEDQLSAILLASKEVSVRVMFPMITIEEEVVWARSVLADMEKRVGGEIGVGMMVETPSAALRAADFLGLVDFISIGTNDLTQYTLAADRGNPIVASITHGDNTSVWDLIAMAARAFAGRSVAVCGDLASDPHAVSRLISLGVNELSVRTPLVGVIKQQVRATA